MKQLLAFVLLVTSPLMVADASARPSKPKLSPKEVAFQKAVNERTSPFALHYYNHQQLLHIETLLSSGDIDADIKGGGLVRAVSYGDVELLQLLIRYGANVNQEVEDGRTVLMIAAADLFYVQCGNDLSNISYTGNVAAVKALLDAGSQLDAQNNEGDTALMLAARQARSGSVDLLLCAGANVNLTNSHCETALIYAAEATSAYAQDNVNEIVMGLISSGANLNVRDEHGKTALTYAPRSSAVARMLIAAGAIE